MYILRKLLWVDCTAAALAGVTVLALSGWLSRLYALPHGLLLFVGTANLLYASFSFSLALRAARPLFLIKLLVFANAAWVVACMGLAASFWNQATGFGVAQLIGEALFVGALAALEWNQRHQLATAAGTRRGPRDRARTS